MASSAVNFSLFLRASLVLIGLAWTLPFLQPYHRFPLTSFYSEWLAFALGLAAALPLLRREPWRDATLPVIAFAPLGLIVVLGLQVALGRVPYAEQALTAGLYLLWAALLVLLGHMLRRGLPAAQIATTLAWFLLAGGLLHALIGLIQHYAFSTPLDFLVSRKDQSVIYGNLGQPNHYAVCVTLALVSAAYLYCRDGLHGALAAGCAALFLVVLALAGSRSTWLYLVALGVLALVLHRLQRDGPSRKLAILSAWLLPGFIAAQWLVTLPALLPAEGPVVTSGQRLFEAASGIEPRLQLWSEAWRMFLGAPVLGAGFGQFAWHHFLYQAASGATTAPGVFNHAHNIVMELLAETGLAGALPVVGAVAVWAADLRRARFDPEAWWLLALLAVIGIHSMLEFPLWYADFLGVAALLLGIGATRSIAIRLPGAARLNVAFLLLAGAFNLASVLPHYRDFERLMFMPEDRESRSADEQTFVQAMLGAHREPLLTPYVELAGAYSIILTTDRLREKLELHTRAMRFAPVAVVAYRQALLLALAGERAAALEQLERSLRVYPHEAATIIPQIEDLAQRHPAEMAPLLELATAKFAEWRASRDGK